jgi:hypothetical protein
MLVAHVRTRRQLPRPDWFQLRSLNISQFTAKSMQLRPLYTVRFFYPKGYGVEVKNPADKTASGKEQEMFFFAEGTCEGIISGNFKGANHPRRRADNANVMNLQGFIETDDGALIIADYQGYGRSYQRSQALYGTASDEETKLRRQVVGVAKHYADAGKYRWLNDAICAIAGEVRSPANVAQEQIKQADVKLVFSVAEIVWEAPPE